MSADSLEGASRPNSVASDLIAKLRDHGDDVIEDPSWNAGLREAVVGHVERAVVNHRILLGYIRALRRAKLIKMTFSYRMDLKRLNSLRDLGVRGLSDRELISLAVDPIALRFLSDELRRTSPEAWREARAHDGRLLLEEARCSLPAVEGIFRKTRNERSRP